MSQASQAIFQSISTLLTQRRTAEARAELERLLALDPEDPEARSQAGDVYAYTGAHSAAYKQYNQAAETYNRLGRADMALAVHHKILELDPGTLDSAAQTRLRLLSLLVAAEDAVVAGQYDKAVASYHAAIGQFPNHTISYQRLASLLVRLNRVDEAAEQYLVVAQAFYAHGVKSKARPYFERVLELKPDQAESLEALLACLKFENKESEGIRYIKAAVLASLQAGSAERAVALFKRLPSPAGEESGPLAAALLLQAGESERADRLAARLDLGNVDVQNFFKGLGRAALERGDRATASVYVRWTQGRTSGLAPAPAPAPAPLPPPAPVPPPPLPVAAVPAPPAPLVAPLPLPAPAAGLAPQVKKTVPQQDRTVLRTTGEVCLAEGMFEEARQIFERLHQAQIEDAPYWELLNRARAGLGLSPESLAVPPPPSPPMQPLARPLASGPGAPPSRMLQRPRSSAVPAAPASSVAISRTAYVVQLGELPPAVASAVDQADDLIE
ncbi:MAG TPA: tetratricopeptide repeat protein [bacterium]|nr:tetratricopeptide repeat protein [bacterium]